MMDEGRKYSTIKLRRAIKYLMRDCDVQCNIILHKKNKER